MRCKPWPSRSSMHMARFIPSASACPRSPVPALPGVAQSFILQRVLSWCRACPSTSLPLLPYQHLPRLQGLEGQTHSSPQPPSGQPVALSVLSPASKSPFLGEVDKPHLTPLPKIPHRRRFSPTQGFPFSLPRVPTVQMAQGDAVRGCPPRQ